MEVCSYDGGIGSRRMPEPAARHVDEDHCLLDQVALNADGPDSPAVSGEERSYTTSSFSGPDGSMEGSDV